MELFTPWHVVIVLAVGAMLYFGGGHIPEMSRSLGKSLRIFRNEMKGTDTDEDTVGSTVGGAGAPTRTAPAVAPVAVDPASPSLAAPSVSTPKALGESSVRIVADADRPRPRPKPSAQQTR